MKGPLYELQKNHGARFDRLGEWELPRDFGDYLAEYRAVRERVGLLDRTPRAFIRVSGGDRFSWLQGMVSNDVRRLQAGEKSLQACILSSTGHLLSDVTIINFEDHVVLDLDWQNRLRALEVLEQFLIVEDVDLAFAEDLACISLQGPLASRESPTHESREGALEVSADHTGEGGLDLYAPLGATLDEIWKVLVQSGIQPVGETAAEILRIEAGIPKYGVDMDETTIALEAGLEESHISHTKGCYIGQEIIHRIHSRGHTNRALTGFLVDSGGVPAAGEKLIDASAKEIGRVTSATYSPTLDRGIALGYLRHEHRTPGENLRTETGIALTVSDLPFIPAK